ncbi:P-loop containing nucleoside triphosphate hydrolase protein [Gongronella butleri]|nr:P-loop containing nucleoside triphosphate hydrolase protein [Gongronella butleri]
MMDFLSSFWLSCYLATVAAASALVLSVQRGLSRAQGGNIRLTDENLQRDHERDGAVPFSDTQRLPRLTFDATLVILWAAWQFFAQSTVSEGTDDDRVHLIVGSAVYLVAWLYATAIVLVARRHTLPSDWGTVLNGHLALFSFVAWLISLRHAWIAYWDYAASPWPRAVPWIIESMLILDIFVTTITMPRGAPFLDAETRRPVLANGVASIWSFLTYSYMTDLVKLAKKKKKLENEDLPILPADVRSRNALTVFAKRRKSSLFYRIFMANRKEIAMQFLLVSVVSIVYYAPAYFINRLLYLVEDISHGLPMDVAFRRGILITVALGLGSLAIAFISCQVWYIANCIMLIRVRAMLHLEIYRKTMYRMDASVVTSDITDESDEDKKEDKQEDKKDHDDASAGTGTIVNLMSTDSQRITDFCTSWFSVYGSMAELCVGMAILYQLLGNASLFGLLVMVLFLPVNHINSKVYTKFQDRLMEARDRRVNLMNEILQGIRHIKFFAWEANWAKRVEKERNNELRHLRSTLICDIVFDFIFFLYPVLITAASFYFYTVVQGHALTAPVAFTSITVLNELRFSLIFIPGTIIEWMQAMVSVRRVDKFLHERDIDPRPAVDVNASVVIAFEEAAVGFKAAGSGNDDGFVLKNMTMRFPNGHLSLVCGPTGSGKTLLLLSLLGESVLLSGQIHFPRAPVIDTVTLENDEQAPIPEANWLLEHAVAYVAQTAWLQNVSIRDNILFGLPYVEKRYKDTLHACSLEPDLAILSHGDATVIGEKGITLSGGQKARVALARAVYSRANIVLMDDILSAVDAHTARHIYDHCLTGALMHGRTQILVTHHVRLCVDTAQFLVHLHDGQPDLVGAPDQLREHPSWTSILEEEETTADIEDKKTMPKNKDTTIIDKKEPMEPVSPHVLVEEENREVGSVKWHYYKVYLKHVGGIFFWVVFLGSLIVVRGLDVMEGTWLKVWTRANERASRDNGTDSDLHVYYYLGMYLLIMFANVVLGTSRFVLILAAGLRASRQIYKELLHRVLHAPLRFYDTTPHGRIINRFSSDVEAIDSSVPNNVVQFLVQWLQAISVLVVAITVVPLFAVPVIIFTIVTIMLGTYFVYASRELRRMQSVNHSPLITHFAETIVGIQTIRAFGATRRFLHEMIRRNDSNSQPVMLTNLVERWISMRYVMVGSSISFISAWVVLLNLDRIDAAQAGFFLSFICVFTDEMFFAIQRYSSIEVAFNHVERVSEYLEIDNELDNGSVTPPEKWPSKGAIEIKNLKVRYDKDLDLVLRDVNVSIKPGERIGIVGRTGSGKSTMTLALFRFVELVDDSKITIDGIDIMDVPLHDLRSRMTVVPQAPTLFSGTLRSNMDPFGEFSDSAILEAFQRVHLIRTPVASADASTSNSAAVSIDQAIMPKNVFENLDSLVSEGGKNLSQGQRQLLCLARALLKRTKIVVMDEATSSVDFETDRAIQATVRSELDQCTVLCVAHRLATISDFDRVLVLDQGKVIEFASPWDLLNDSQSAFHGMCRASGEFDSLFQAAKTRNEL